MKYTVTVDEIDYEVEIESLHTRPIVAIVDGSRFEIWPKENEIQFSQVLPVSTNVAQSGAQPAPASGHIPSGATLNLKVVRAPIPGVIVDIKVRVGEAVEFGQILFTIEAMKMRNAIRASRTGTVKDILVSIGQTVNHNDILLEFTE